MLASNRQDDLLSKLKSCIGSLKHQPTPSFHDGKIATYNSIKENYQNSTIIGKTNMPTTSLPINNKTNSYAHYAERKPLVASNHAVPTASYIPSHNYPQHQPQQTYRHEAPPLPNRYEPQIRQKTKADDYRSYDTTPRKFDYNFDARKLERQQRPPIEKIKYEQPNKSRQDIRSQITRRYSVMQNDRVTPKYASQAQQLTPVKIAPSRNYQQQVEQRKELLEGGAYDRKERTPQLSKEYIQGSIRKEANYTSRDPGKIKPSEPILSSRKPERPLMVVQNLQRAYEEERNVNPNECSALTKLKKISQLNQKINDRIRNIINVFEEHKK